MATPPDDVRDAYISLLGQAIINMRARIRYEDGVTLDEVHDFLDALHNVPIMLLKYGGWHIEENINADLSRYDDQWMGKPGAELRNSMIEMLKNPPGNMT